MKSIQAKKREGTKKTHESESFMQHHPQKHTTFSQGRLFPGQPHTDTQDLLVYVVVVNQQKSGEKMKERKKSERSWTRSKSHLVSFLPTVHVSTRTNKCLRQPPTQHGSCTGMVFWERGIRRIDTNMTCPRAQQNAPDMTGPLTPHQSRAPHNT